MPEVERLTRWLSAGKNPTMIAVHRESDGSYSVRLSTLGLARSEALLIRGELVARVRKSAQRRLRGEAARSLTGLGLEAYA